MDNITLSVSTFCQTIKDILPHKKFTVQGQVNQLKNSQGHLYFTFKDNDHCINATIWKSKVISIKTPLKEGDKITVEGKLDFYALGGKLNFIIDKVLTNEGIGDLLQKYEQMKSNFTKLGYFSRPKKPLVHCIKNILLLTSETGAAYHDFIYGLNNANMKINITLRNVIVQGIDCAKNISIELESIKDSMIPYDLVILTRGGGSFQDLFGFSEPELITTLYNFNVGPTLSAIGHQIDNPLSDLVCDYSAPTPSLAAQFIVDHNRSYINNIKKAVSDLSNQLNIQLMNDMTKTSTLLDKVNNQLLRFERTYKQNILLELNSSLRRLEQLEAQLSIYETSNIILNARGKILKNRNMLLNYKGKTMEIIWNGVIVKVNIESISEL